jgi:nitrate reductase delta subunit
VFDFNTRHSPYLTWWLDGDTRRRGASLVELKQAYCAAGLVPGEQELPDFLPVVLEAVCATLPGPSPKDRAEARALAAAGPQSESVGLGAAPDVLAARPYGHLDLLPVVSPGP